MNTSKVASKLYQISCVKALLILQIVPYQTLKNQKLIYLPLVVLSMSADELNPFHFPLPIIP